MVHRYIHPGTFVVAVECTGADMHITAEKIITIEEPVAEMGVIRCYAGNLFFHATNCKALYGETFQIQVEVKAGRWTNATCFINMFTVMFQFKVFFFLWRYKCDLQHQEWQRVAAWLLCGPRKCSP